MINVVSNDQANSDEDNAGPGNGVEGHVHCSSFILLEIDCVYYVVDLELVELKLLDRLLQMLWEENSSGGDWWLIMVGNRYIYYMGWYLCHC